MTWNGFKQKWFAFWSRAWLYVKLFFLLVVEFAAAVVSAAVALLTAVYEAMLKAAGRIKTGWAEFKKNPFFVKEYGDSLMTEKTWSTIKVFAWVISIQFAIDFVAWGRVGAYGFPKETMGAFIHYGAMVFVGLSLGLAILLFDRTVITIDTSKSRTQLWPLFGRAVILFAISFVTAIPVELTLYEPAITTRLEAKQKKAVDEIRTRAIAEEQAAFDKKVVSAQDDLTKISEGYTLLKKRVAEYQGERAAARKQAEDQRAAGAALLQKSIDEQRDAVNKEMDGTGGSGHRGKATIADYKEVLMAKLIGDKRQYDSETAAILAKFDSETAAGVKEREAALTLKSRDDESVGKSRLDDLRAEKDRKVEFLRKMPAGELSQKYGGDWKYSFDFLTRYRELATMSKEDPLVRWSVWGCRLVLIALGLLILFLKAMAPEEFKRYYSLSAQIAYGQRLDVVEQGVVAGYADKQARQTLGFSREVRALHKDLGTARRKLAGAYARYCQQVQTLASQINPATGCHYHIEVLRSTAHDWWVRQPQEQPSVLECALALEQVEDRCRLNGVAITPWPAYLGADPRDLSEPWNIPEDDAILYGWNDPKPKLMSSLSDKLADARYKLAQAYAYFRSALAYWCQEHNPKTAPGMELAHIHALLAEQWRMHVLPAIHTLAKAELECKSSSMTLPPWPAELGCDPRTLDQPWQPSPDELVKLGWSDPTSAIADVGKAREEVLRQRALVEARIDYANLELAQDLIDRPHEMPLEYFKRLGSARLGIWRAEILPYLSKLEAAVRVLQAAGEEVPEWTPPRGASANGWLISEELLTSLGWVKPSPQPEHADDGLKLEPDSEATTLLDELGQARSKLAEAVSQFSIAAADVCQNKSDGGLCLPRAMAESELKRQWHHLVLPAIQEADRAERFCRLGGVKIPDWIGTDMRKLAEDALADAAGHLEQMGWEDPARLIQDAAKAGEQYQRLHEVMEHLVDELNLDLAAFIRLNPGISAEEVQQQLEPARLDAWKNVIHPSMQELAEVTRTIMAAGGSTPSWAPEFNPGPFGWQLDIPLLQQYGWTEPPPPPMELPVPAADAEPLSGEPADLPPSAPPADTADPSNGT